jgi:hypothetical protein
MNSWRRLRDRDDLDHQVDAELRDHSRRQSAMIGSFLAYMLKCKHSSCHSDEDSPIETLEAETPSSFRDRPARVYALRDMLTDPLHSEACFQDFEGGLDTSRRKLKKRHPGRGWQALFGFDTEPTVRVDDPRDLGGAPAGRLTGGGCHGFMAGRRRGEWLESPRRDRGDGECRPERRLVGVSCG